MGYWLPTDRLKNKRTLVYILRHSSRYEAWKNWKSFTHDDEWEAVLERPEFQRLLSDRPTSIFMTANDYSTTVRNAVLTEGGIFELRTDVAPPGKLPALNARFRDHTTRLYNKHGIKSIGYWTPFDRPESENTLIYLIHHLSIQQADANWNAFNSDPEWKDIVKESQIDGRLTVKPPDRIYLKATDFSPLK